ncbi:c-type cytochrome [Halalkalibacillus halophilus]|uniref:c-type cytochrome n=1 Tax=Halalkalibacillus halophilus TaxID=392827 RepID=UPI0003FDC09D|nr:cytochrome c [Halalkalibacillus halophilus]
MNKKLLLAIIGLILIVALAACGGDDEGSGDGDSGETAQGEELFQQNCAQCHGGDLEGAAGPSLENVGATYEQDGIVQIIQEGTGAMAPIDDVNEEEANEIAEWVLTQE